ncbi:hypothetical protein BAU15_05230 [Enterococcus sp. JM4C]|nr:hypothetical protein BAU15_05230 [Enterococcus sp. JM4C]
MNTSIYLKLWIANLFKKVKIKEKYKHLDFLIENDLIEQLPDGTWGEVAGFPAMNYGDYYKITVCGKKELFSFQSSIVTRVISIVALVISVLSYLRK